eukprot:GEMP01054287.1.p1 GENE.GEMP01054287.1~~GEMP01054287.1.p1  ORF type:complete len:287 (+),score=1.61 GEMP01054287.1:55-861(+)
MGLFLNVLAVDFGIQAVFAVTAILLNTEKFFDFVGSLTFITCTLLSVFYESIDVHEMKMVQAFCICIWAGKLGSFLLYRVICSKGDKRFVEIKKSPIRFFGVWMIQGAWVYLNMLPSLLVFSAKKENPELVSISLAGWVIFAFGLIFETVADYQKTVFRNMPENKDKYITTGLWSISRHPNYFGEIVLWYGLFIAAAPYFTSACAYLTVICPTLTTLMIIYVSGVPMLEKSGMEKWVNDPKYVEYLQTTSCIVPLLGRRHCHKKIENM